jgi:predicted amidophosphoribosyltransferase
MRKLPNPKGTRSGRWFTLPEYPADIIVCPLCGLPENGNYRRMCHCWDEPAVSVALMTPADLQRFAAGEEVRG